MKQTAYNWMELDQVGGAGVVRFTSHAIVDARAIQILTEELVRLVDELGHRRLVLDFGSVRNISSSMLTTLLKLHQRLNAAGGRLALCCINPDLHQVFKLTKLDNLLNIYPSESDAITSI